MQNIHLRAIRSYYSAEAGQLVTLDDDVLSVVSQVRELTDGQVSVQFDPVTECYHLVAHEEDGTDRLVFTVEELDARVVTRLMAADSRSRAYEDPYDKAEREQDEIFAQQEALSRDKVRAAGERLQHALRKSGEMPRMPLPVAFPKGLNADR